MGPPGPPGGLGIGVGKKYSAHPLISLCVRLGEASQGPRRKNLADGVSKKSSLGGRKVLRHLKITRVSICRLILNEICMFLMRHIIYQSKLNDM